VGSALDKAEKRISHSGYLAGAPAKFVAVERGRGQRRARFTIRNVRLFIAIELSDAWREALAAQQAFLRRALGGEANLLRWVRPEGCHLTLLFLGETPSDAVPRIRAALDAAVGGARQFELRLGRCGSFGGRSPRVIWTGLDGDLDALARLQQHVVEAVGADTCEGERFSPHVTLARVPRPSPRSSTRAGPIDAQALSRALARVPAADDAPLSVEAIGLIESDLRPGGAVYTCRYTAPLVRTTQAN
jgi:2'-5' RNA ligase